MIASLNCLLVESQSGQVRNEQSRISHSSCEDDNGVFGHGIGEVNKNDDFVF